MILRKTTAADVDLLIKLRIAYLLDQNEKESLDNLDMLTENLRQYFVKAIRDDVFFAIIAEEGKEIYATAFLSIADRPPRLAEASCRIGTVYNVYTYPQYRKRGLATAVMSTLLQEAKIMNIASIDLLASSEGKPLYEKLGFKIPNHIYMRRKIEV